MASQSRDLPFVGDSFNVGYRFQRYWDTSMANAFFACELGGGIFIVSLLLNYAPGMLVGLIFTGILKPYFHLTHMGVPLQSWRAILRPDRSWISRGTWGIMAFTAFGGLYWLIVAFGLDAVLGLPAFITGLIKLLAVLATLVVMTYQGFAMSHSTAISLWSTGLMPISSLVYSAGAGVLVVLAMAGIAPSEELTAARGLLVNTGLVLLLVIAGTVLSLLHGAYHGSPGGRKSVETLTRTFYARWFYSLIWGAGLVLPALCLWFAPGSQAALLLAAAGYLVGFYTYRLLVLKAGVFEPIMSFRP